MFRQVTARRGPPAQRVALGLICFVCVAACSLPVAAVDLSSSSTPLFIQSNPNNPDDVYWNVDFANGGMNDIVWVLYRHGGLLYAGGQFTSVGGTAAPHVAVFDGATWSALGDGTNGRVFNFLDYNGDLIVGGEFTAAGGASRGYIARWDGSTWHSLGSGLNGAVRALTVYQGDLIVGGDFTLAGGVFTPKIARWNGSSWSAMGSGFSGGYQNLGVRSLAVFRGRLFAGGFFRRSGSTLMDFMAIWNKGAQTWEPAGSGLPGVGYALLAHGQQLFAGSVVWFQGTGTWEDVFRAWPGGWNPLGSGTLSAPFPNAGRAFTVRGGRVVAVGQFPQAANTQVNYVAKWDGAAWHAFGSGADAPVYAVETFQGHLYAGGEFASIGGQAAGRIARWEGTPDNAFSAFDLSAEAVDAGVALSWTLCPNSVTEIAAVRVQRKAPNNTFVDVASPLAPETAMSHLDVDVAPGAVHTYRLVFDPIDGPPSMSAQVSNDPRSPRPGGSEFEPLEADADGNVRFTFEVPRAGTPTRIALYNARGQRVQEILRHASPAGLQTFVWNASGGNTPLGRGVYFVAIDVGAQRTTRKLVWLRDSRRQP